MAVLTPGTEAELAEAVADAAGRTAPLEIAGGGTRRALGRPVQAADTLSTAGISGIELYEPGALTLIVRAGTPLAEVETALAAEGQRLPFEPVDHRALLGSEGEPTIGGAVACAVSGPRRIEAGACRDAMLGVRFVTGEGQAVRNGGRVMKNVTGYDLVKLLCGSYGTLGVLTEVAFKLQPRPERELSLVIEGLEDARAQEAMATALAAPFDVSGAAHLPGGDPIPARTVLRVEGMAEQAIYRARQLESRLAAFGAVARAEGEAHAALWHDIGECRAFADRAGAVWRISVTPSEGPALVAAVGATRAVSAVYDWAGGLVWLLTAADGDAGAAAIRAETARRGGHATLFRAPEPVRAAVPVFEPEPPVIARLSAGLRARFDPQGILNPGRMGG